MSKIGRTPITLKEGITISMDGASVTATGAKGELSFRIPKGIIVQHEGQQLLVTQQKENDPVTRPVYGLTRSLLFNMVEGVAKGYQKQLELQGVGYRAVVQGADLVLQVGFSHPVKIQPLSGISFTVADNIITVSGIDKALVGDIAAKIRAVRPPEPYKGKGIRYVGEHVRRKAGKAAKAVGGK